MELTLNLIPPFEYDPRISSYEGLMGHPYDFNRHPIAPAGSKVLTWDSPDNRETWADHGGEGIYVGPALDHFRAFRIWVPQHSAMRISGTVWWFHKPVRHDDSAAQDIDNEIAYPPTKLRPSSLRQRWIGHRTSSDAYFPNLNLGRASSRS
jgi:hypothetical protein